MSIASCPLCNEEVILSQPPTIGQHAICQACDAKLEVVWLYPLTLDEEDETTQ